MMARLRAIGETDEHALKLRLSVGADYFKLLDTCVADQDKQLSKDY